VAATQTPETVLLDRHSQAQIAQQSLGRTGTKMLMTGRTRISVIISPAGTADAQNIAGYPQHVLMLSRTGSADNDCGDVHRNSAYLHMTLQRTVPCAELSDM
jgi:hypothetical protein